MTVYKRGRSYYFDFRLEGQRHYGRIGPVSKTEAENAEAIRRQELLTSRLNTEFPGLRRPTPRRVPSVRDFLHGTGSGDRFAGQWAASVRGSAPGSVRVALSCVDIFTRQFGDLRLDRITPATLEQFKTDRLRTVAAATVYRDFAWLRDFFRVARVNGYITESPIRRAREQGFRLPRRAIPFRRIPTADEEQRFFTAFLEGARGRWRASRERARDMIRLLALTSLRPVELRTLRQGHVDLTGKQLVIPQSKVGDRVKEIPLRREALELLRRHLRPDAPDDALVFPGPRGRPYDWTTIWQHFARARTAARLPWLQPYALRHAVATRLMEQGATLGEVGDILGHKPPYRQTLIYVAHVTKQRKRDLMDRLDQIRLLREPTQLEQALEEVRELRRIIAGQQALLESQQKSRRSDTSPQPFQLFTNRTQ